MKLYDSVSSMDTTTPLSTAITLQRTTRNYSGEFTDVRSFSIEPAVEPQLIAYWGLEVTEIISEKGTTIHQRIKLASLSTEGQCRSAFGQDYYSSTEYNRLSLELIPELILDAISASTGETLIRS